MELKEDRKIYIFEKREGRWEKSFIVSVFFHFLLILFLLFSFKLFPHEFFKVTGDGGSIRIGDTISAGLVASVSGKSNFYKPPLRKLKRKKYVVKKKEESSIKNVFKESKKVKKVEKKRKEISKEKEEGSIYGESNVDEGIKKGEVKGAFKPSMSVGGVSLGMGGTRGGIYSSWYAREVEAKISRNWLTSQMGVVYNRICKVVITFEITPSGKIVNVKVSEKNAPTSFVRSALRAIYASNPLPELPLEYKMKGENVKFIAIFEYPPR